MSKLGIEIYNKIEVEIWKLYLVTQSYIF